MKYYHKTERAIAKGRKEIVRFFSHNGVAIKEITQYKEKSGKQILISETYWMSDRGFTDLATVRSFARA